MKWLYRTTYFLIFCVFAQNFMRKLASFTGRPVFVRWVADDGSGKVNTTMLGYFMGETLDTDGMFIDLFRMDGTVRGISFENTAPDGELLFYTEGHEGFDQLLKKYGILPVHKVKI